MTIFFLLFGVIFHTSTGVLLSTIISLFGEQKGGWLGYMGMTEQANIADCFPNQGGMLDEI